MPTQRSLVLDPPTVSRSIGVFDSDSDSNEESQHRRGAEQHSPTAEEAPSSYSKIHALRSSNRPLSAPQDTNNNSTTSTSAKRPVPPKQPRHPRTDVDESALSMPEGQRLNSLVRPMQLMRGRAGGEPSTLARKEDGGGGGGAKEDGTGRGKAARSGGDEERGVRVRSVSAAVERGGSSHPHLDDLLEQLAPHTASSGYVLLAM